MLWGTINTLQLIVMATLFNLNFPDNAQTTFKMIAYISSFNIIPTDDIVNELFQFESGNIINDNFLTMGYESSNIIWNLNTILLYLIGIIIIIIFTIMTN